MHNSSMCDLHKNMSTKNQPNENCESDKARAKRVEQL